LPQAPPSEVAMIELAYRTGAEVALLGPAIAGPVAEAHEVAARHWRCGSAPCPGRR
jgi:hypothetical protein